MQASKMPASSGRLILILLLIIIIASISFVGCNKSNSSGNKNGDVQLYTCGMHPEVITDEPGLCPICNMKLTPISGTGGSPTTSSGERRILYWAAPMDPLYIRDEPGKSPMGMDLIPVYEDEVMSQSGISIDPAVIQNMGVRFAQAKMGELAKTIIASAHVDYNEEHISVLSVRSDGWVEKLYVSSPGEDVKAGDPLFEFYSPKLYSAQQEYVIAIKSGSQSLINSSKERLRLLGVSDTQIEKIRKTGAHRTLTMTAPIDGVVVEIGQSGSSGISTSGEGGGSTGGMDMGGGGSSSGGMNTGSGATVREGDHISSGTALFTIANLDSLWVYAHIYADELPYIKEGMTANLTLNYLPGEIFSGTVDFVYPYLDKQTRDIKIRMTFDNLDKKLLPQMYGKVAIESKISDNALLIPKEAVIYAGNSRVVFLALPAGKFAPQAINLGVSDGKGNVQVLSGLVDGQTIVTSGQFLLDSESRLKEALNNMLASRTNSNNNAESQMELNEDGWVDLAPDDPNAKFKCEMIEDKYYTAEDGECPVCGMFLVPNDFQQEENDHSNH